MAPILCLFTLGFSLVSLSFPVLHKSQTRKRYWISKSNGDFVKQFLSSLIFAGKITSWAKWVDKELSNADFVGCLECVGVLKSVAMTKNLECFRDVKALRHLA